MAHKLIMAENIAQAFDAYGCGAAFLAGGTEINRLDSSISADTLISLSKVKDIKGICEDGDMVWIGSMTTFQEAVESEIVPEYFKDGCKLMASRTKRNMASIGGNIALLRDDSYIVPCLIGAAARIKFMVKGGAAEEICICEYMNKKAAGELGDAMILAIGLDKNRKVFTKRYANTAMSHSVLNIGYGFGGAMGDVTIGAAIKNAGLFKLCKFEDAVNSDPEISEEALLKMAREFDICEIPSDMFGSSEYKKYLLGVTIAKMAADSRKEA